MDIGKYERECLLDLSSLVDSSINSDAVFVCSDGVSVNAHTLLLRTRCPFFETSAAQNSILSTEEEFTVNVEFRSAAVRQFVHFLYSGSTPDISLPLDKYSRTVARDTLSVAYKFHSESLSEYVSDLLITAMKENEIVSDDDDEDDVVEEEQNLQSESVDEEDGTEENEDDDDEIKEEKPCGFVSWVVSLLRVARQCNLDELASVCCNVLDRRIIDVIMRRTEDDISVLEELLKRDSLCVEEEVLFLTLEKWRKKDSEMWIPLVRFSVMDVSFFLSNVEKSDSIVPAAIRHETLVLFSTRSLGVSSDSEDDITRRSGAAPFRWDVHKSSRLLGYEFLINDNLVPAIVCRKSGSDSSPRMVVADMLWNKKDTWSWTLASSKPVCVGVGICAGTDFDADSEETWKEDNGVYLICNKENPAKSVRVLLRCVEQETVEICVECDGIKDGERNISVVHYDIRPCCVIFSSHDVFLNLGISSHIE